MRKARRLRRGATYHVVARANRSEFILQSESMKLLFVETVARAKERFGFGVTNICIMDNHFHLMITPPQDASLSRIMQWILSVFALRFNRAHGYRGHVWYDRFKSKVIESLRQFVATFRYVQDNSVKAGLVDRPAEYRWGGMRLLGSGPGWIVDAPTRIVQLLFPEFAPVTL